MSIDIDWEKLTTGPEGLELAESIRTFIHDKFQQVALPRFIKSVEVHSFEFGKECPVVELKDICDPLPDFYEDGDVEEGDEAELEAEQQRPQVEIGGAEAGESLSERRRGPGAAYDSGNHSSSSGLSHRPSYIDTRLPALRSNLSFVDHIATPLLSRSSTPGIAGGTSNLGYFHLPHLPLSSAGLSGTQTPLAAVSGGTPFSTGWQDHHAPPWEHHMRNPPPRGPPLFHDGQDRSYADPSTRPSTAQSDAEPSYGLSRAGSLDGTDQPPSNNGQGEPNPMDLQVVLRIQYSGSIRLSLTAEILLDYPMPSFVGIPLKLNITGLSFDGVALIAYLRKTAHFCFLGQEDAEMLVNLDTRDPESYEQRSKDQSAQSEGKQDRLRGLLREIRVESEIGQKEGGKQVLKNVGKVEKFVLDQVRRIFEDECVYPSFWTFLV
jgi:distribution and morphology protein 12